MPALALLLAGRLQLDVRGMAAVVFGQTLWCVLVAAWVLREGARARAAPQMAS